MMNFSEQLKKFTARGGKMNEMEIQNYDDFWAWRVSIDWDSMSKAEQTEMLKKCNILEGKMAMKAEMEFQRKLKEKRRAQ